VSELVSMRTDGGVAVITIDNPPVNAMKHEVRLGLLDLISRAAGDPENPAIIIACAGRTFVAGAEASKTQIAGQQARHDSGEVVQYDRSAL
jgi:3-hydroxyacyl-CoA dehydrogenase